MKKKCIACGLRFMPNSESIYRAYEPITSFQALAVVEKWYDVMDCPRCGYQNVLAVRLPAVNNNTPSGEV